MKWPAKEWNTITRDLPKDADRALFCAMVDEAVNIYKAEADDSELWERINELLHSKAVDKLFQTIQQLKTRPPSLAQKYLLDVRQVAGFQAQYERSRVIQRRERFYLNLIIACERAGLRLSNSADGPMARIIKTIVNTVIPIGGHTKKHSDEAGLSNAGIREIFKREIKRREEIKLLKETAQQ
jgi:hypothetical protein